MHHMRFCLEEILAEIDAVLEQSDHARALEQLAQRDRGGEPVTAIDEDELRLSIMRRIESQPLKQARNRILEATELMSIALETKGSQSIESNVVRMPANRKAAQPDPSAHPAPPENSPSPPPTPQFKSMQERLAQAVGRHPIKLAQPKRA